MGSAFISLGSNGQINPSTRFRCPSDRSGELMLAQIVQMMPGDLASFEFHIWISDMCANPAMGHTLRASQIDLGGPHLDPPKPAILSPPNEGLPATAGNPSFQPKPKSAQMRASRIGSSNLESRVKSPCATKHSDRWIISVITII